MSYTVVGLFPNNETAQDASERLANADFPRDSYDVSNYRVDDDQDLSTDIDRYDYEEDKHTGGFWDRLFGSDKDNDNDNDVDAAYNRKAYGYAGSKNNVVTVYTDDQARAEEARQIMDDAGAVSVDDHLPDNFYADYPEYSDRNTNTYATGMGLGNETDLDTYVNNTLTDDAVDYSKDTNNIEVVKEDINVGKKEVSGGGVKIRSRIIERPVEEDVRLRNERVYIRRNPVNREVRNADNAFQDASIELNQTREVPVVEKTARVVEEISLDKEVDERIETVKDTVRETQVDIEDTTDEKTFNNNRDNINRNNI